MKRLFFVAGLLLLVTLTGLRCTRGIPPEVTQANKPVTLTWWRVFDDEVTVRPIIEAYRTVHPNVNIIYRKLRFDEYEGELLNALAEDRGPDILSVHNTWMGKYQPKLAPLPPTITLPFPELKGTLKKETVVTLRTTPTLSLSALKNSFVDAVVKDVIVLEPAEKQALKERIYGLPLGLDTLSLYVNRDLLNLAQVPQAPKTWTEFQGVVKQLTKLNEKGELIQSGAAIGASRNIERAADVLAALMMQNGTAMIDESGYAAFHKVPLGGDRALIPGEQALVFYSDFANPQKEVYTWSAQETPSLNAFTSGRTAMFFGYAYHLPLIRARAPRLNLEIAKLPQIEGNPEINLANYWIESVSKKSKHQTWAWDFIQFATSPAQVNSYLEVTKKPTALRALIARQLEDESTGIFATQVLTAKSWYRGKNVMEVETALLDAIDAVLAGGEAREILNIAASRVNQTLR